jgi:NAD+ diphosphatase
MIHTYAGSPLERVSERRGDAEWISARLADASSEAIALWNGRPLVTSRDGSVRLVRLEPKLAQLLVGTEQDLAFLGHADDCAIFAADLDGEADPTKGPLTGRGRFDDLRKVTPLLSGADAALAATARALFEWSRRHRFCANCGQPSRVVQAGWRRDCPACRAQHFPRTDPVVIMLPVIGERCLVGRQAAWDPGRFSALAGYMEPGESIEEACAREVAEECGLTVTAVRYHSSQPWPYPSSLMIGLIAEVAEGEATPDQTELEEVRWLTRQEARELIEGRLAQLSAPWPQAIAYHLIRDWAYGAA